MALANSQTALLVIEKKGSKIYFASFILMCDFFFLSTFPSYFMACALTTERVYRLCVCTTLVCSSSSSSSSECTEEKDQMQNM